ncbi:MAG: rubrerythrin family protein [Dehalococcoidales bacterium]|nr:MAG: rubrerythrin family protein [Dehalococcoidales bacterium]
MSETDDNLREAFAGESQAYQRYLFFADKAGDEGQPQVARLFRAAAEAEKVHAGNFFSIMDGVGSSKDNLLAGSIGEHYEFTRVYPSFIEKAQEDRSEWAQIYFEYANEVEKIHHDLFQRALKVLEAGQQLEGIPYFVCPVCGNTVEGKAPDTCPICGAPGDMFKRVE